MSEEKNLVLENQNNDEMQVLSIRVSRLLADKFKYMASLENRSQGEFFEGLMQLKENENKPNLPEEVLTVTTLLPEINSNSANEVIDSKRIIFNGKRRYVLFEGDYKEGCFHNINITPNINLFQKRCPALLNYIPYNDYIRKYTCEIYEKYNSIGEVEDFIIYEKVELKGAEKNSSIFAIWSDYLLTSKNDVSMILAWNSLNVIKKKEILEAVAKIERL